MGRNSARFWGGGQFPDFLPAVKHLWYGHQKTAKRKLRIPYNFFESAIYWFPSIPSSEDSVYGPKIPTWFFSKIFMTPKNRWILMRGHSHAPRQAYIAMVGRKNRNRGWNFFVLIPSIKMLKISDFHENSAIPKKIDFANIPPPPSRSKLIGP